MSMLLIKPRVGEVLPRQQMQDITCSSYAYRVHKICKIFLALAETAFWFKANTKKVFFFDAWCERLVVILVQY